MIAAVPLSAVMTPLTSGPQRYASMWRCCVEAASSSARTIHPPSMLGPAESVTHSLFECSTATAFAVTKLHSITNENSELSRSPLAAWVENVPLTPSDTPFEVDEADEMRFFGLHASAEILAENLAEAVQQHPSLLTAQQKADKRVGALLPGVFMWALYAARARTLFVPLVCRDRVVSPVMVPIVAPVVDRLNHDAHDANCEVRLEFGGAARAVVALRARRAIVAGEELRLRYHFAAPFSEGAKGAHVYPFLDRRARDLWKGDIALPSAHGMTSRRSSWLWQYGFDEGDM